MSCGVNIPLSDLVELIIRDYADAFAQEIIQRLDLSSYLTEDKLKHIKDNTLENITLKGTVTVDNTAKEELCKALSECVNTKIDTKLEQKAAADNYVQEFSIDNTNDLLIIRMKQGEEFSVSREELEAWLRLKGGGGGGSRLERGSLDGTVLNLTNSDKSVVTVDLASLISPDTHLQTMELQSNELVLTLTNGTVLRQDLSTILPNKTDLHLRSGVLTGTTLELELSDGQKLQIDLSNLKGATLSSRPRIESGQFTGQNLELVRDDQSKVTVSLEPLIKALTSCKYRIVTQQSNYTITTEDMDTATIIRANAATQQVISVPTPPNEDYIGTSVIIRKTAGAEPDTHTIVGISGAKVSPADITPLRRIGNTVTLVYTGNGNWDAFGELP